MTIETQAIEEDINQSRHRLNDTLSKIGNKLSPGQILDEALGLLQGQAGQFAGNLGRQVRDNPLPVVLVGAGVAWMIMGRGQSRQTYSVPASYPGADLTRWPEESDDDYAHRVHLNTASRLGLVQGASESVSDFKMRVAKAAEGVSHAAHRVTDRISQGAASATHFAKDAGRKAASAVSHARGAAGSMYETNPLAVSAIGFTIGALIGSLTPLTDLERQSLQPAADATRKAAADLAERGAAAMENQTAVH